MPRCSSTTQPARPLRTRRPPMQGATPKLRATPVPATRIQSPGLIGESRLARFVLVVFTERVPDGTIRIISARPATKRERRAYAEGD